jgi:hypothetical protein
VEFVNGGLSFLIVCKEACGIRTGDGVPLPVPLGLMPGAGGGTRSYLNLCGLTLRSMSSRNCDQALVLNGAASFFGLVAPHSGQAISSLPASIL